MVTSDASVIARAADMGINYFDTCRSYQHGNNERLVATGLKGKRQNIVSFQQDRWGHQAGGAARA